MVCKSCNRENRKIAKYCRWCGTPLPVATTDALDKLVAMDRVKEQIGKILELHASMKINPDTSAIRLNTNILIIGEEGTGKTLLARILKDIFFENQIITRPLLKIVEADDCERLGSGWDKDIDELKGGILFIDDAHKLLAGNNEQKLTMLDNLFMEMAYWNNDPIVILSGLPGELEEYLKYNPFVRNRFKYTFRLPAYKANELRDICLKILNDQFGGIQVSSEAFEVLTAQFENASVNQDPSLRNGHYAMKKAADIYQSYRSRHEDASGILQPGDLPGVQ